MGWLSWLLGPKVDEIEVTEVRRFMTEGAALIDVREPPEWTSGHVQGARLVPLARSGSRAIEVAC